MALWSIYPSIISQMVYRHQICVDSIKETLILDMNLPIQQEVNPYYYICWSQNYKILVADKCQFFCAASHLFNHRLSEKAAICCHQWQPSIFKNKEETRKEVRAFYSSRRKCLQCSMFFFRFLRRQIKSDSRLLEPASGAPLNCLF